MDQIQYVYFWLLKKAWIACNRGSFEDLIMPFWNPIRHHLLHNIITNWFTDAYKLIFFCTIPFIFYMHWKYLCNTFYACYLQNPRCVKRKGFPCRQANKKTAETVSAILMLIGNLSVSHYNDTISAYLPTKEPKKAGARKDKRQTHKTWH